MELKTLPLPQVLPHTVKGLCGLSWTSQTRKVPSNVIVTTDSQVSMHESGNRNSCICRWSFRQEKLSGFAVHHAKSRHLLVCQGKESHTLCTWKEDDTNLDNLISKKFSEQILRLVVDPLLNEYVVVIFASGRVSLLVAATLEEAATCRSTAFTTIFDARIMMKETVTSAAAAVQLYVVSSRREEAEISLFDLKLPRSISMEKKRVRKGKNKNKKKKGKAKKTEISEEKKEAASIRLMVKNNLNSPIANYQLTSAALHVKLCRASFAWKSITGETIWQVVFLHSDESTPLRLSSNFERRFSEKRALGSMSVTAIQNSLVMLVFGAKTYSVWDVRYGVEIEHAAEECESISNIATSKNGDMVVYASASKSPSSLQEKNIALLSVSSCKSRSLAGILGSFSAADCDVVCVSGKDGKRDAIKDKNGVVISRDDEEIEDRVTRLVGLPSLKSFLSGFWKCVELAKGNVNVNDSSKKRKAAEISTHSIDQKRLKLSSGKHSSIGFSQCSVNAIVNRCLTSLSDKEEEAWQPIEYLLDAGAVSARQCPALLPTALKLGDLSILQSILEDVTDLTEEEVCNILLFIIQDSTIEAKRNFVQKFFKDETMGQYDDSSVTDVVIARFVALTVASSLNLLFLRKALCSLKPEEVKLLLANLCLWLEEDLQQLSVKSKNSKRKRRKKKKLGGFRPDAEACLDFANAISDAHFLDLVNHITTDDEDFELIILRLYAAVSHQNEFCRKSESFLGFIKQLTKMSNQKWKRAEDDEYSMEFIPVF
eukprot:g285.t1